jgi:hypothetical protein
MIHWVELLMFGLSLAIQLDYLFKKWNKQNPPFSYLMMGWGISLLACTINVLGG